MLKYLFLLLISKPCFAENANISVKKEMIEPLSFAVMSKVYLVLLGLIFLMIVFAYFYKKMGLLNAQFSPAIQLLGSYPLSTKEKLLIVKVNNQEFLLSLGTGGIQFLSELKESIGDMGCQKTVSFSNVFDKILKRNT